MRRCGNKYFRLWCVYCVPCCVQNNITSPSPLPFLAVLNGEGEDALEDQHQDGGGQVPIGGILLEVGHLPNGDKAMCSEHNPG